MPRREIFKATPFRFALVFAASITCLTLAILMSVYWHIAQTDIARHKALVAYEAGRAASVDNEELQRALTARLSHDFRRLDFIGVYNAQGEIVLGNLPWRPNIAVDGTAYYIDSYDDGAGGEPTLFAARRRADGSVLILGRSLQEVFVLRHTIGLALVAAVISIGLASLALGAFFADKLLRDVCEVNKAIAAIVRGDMQKRWPEISSTPELNDISRAANGMLDEIERLVEQLANVGDNIAHDLRAPIANVRAKIERVLEAEDLPAHLRDSLGRAQMQLDRAMNAVAALLRVSAIESERRKIAFADIDLSAICRDLFEFYEPLALEKGVAPHLNAPRPVWMRGDAALMGEALANIIENAIKFTPAGGKITIETRQGERGAQVSVADNGPGVPAYQREMIFERFFTRATNNRSAAIGEGGADRGKLVGHGIGLSIARMIVKLHGFYLTVEDNRPGARFVIAQEAVRQPAEASKPRAYAHGVFAADV